MAGDHDKSFKFKVDEALFETAKPTLTGLEIRQLAEVPATNQLFLEGHGNKKDDRQIKDGDSVDFSEPGIEKLFTVPPATFGR